MARTYEPMQLLARVWPQLRFRCPSFIRKLAIPVGFIDRLPRRLVGFVIVFGAYVAYLPTSGYDKFFADAANYWDLSQHFQVAGGFSLFGFKDQLRGYSYPLSLHGVRSVADVLGLGPAATVRILNSAVVAVLGTLVVPSLVLKVWPTARITLVRILIFNLLIFLFWRDYLNFPVTDFPALLAGWTAVLLALYRRWYTYLGAGIAAAIALNTRPAYALAAAVLILVVAVRAYRGEVFRSRLFSALAAAVFMVAGVAVVLAPQVAINKHSFNRLSPFPLGNKDLSKLQFTGGLQLQKYETTVNPRASSPSAYFSDASTAATLAGHLDGKPALSGVREYAGIALDHPFLMIRGYFRRIFNGLDVQYTSPYVRNLRADRSTTRSFLLYSLLFAALVTLAISFIRRSLRRVDFVTVGILILPALSAIPSAVEVRFFLPVQLVLFGVLCFNASLRPGLRSIAPRARIALLVAYSVFIVGAFTLADSTYSQLQNPSSVGY